MSTEQQRFGQFFRQAMQGALASAAADQDQRPIQPYPYQVRLATEPTLPDLLSIPTGLGKTAAVVLAWLWRRRFASEAIRAVTPRRLVYCLPMRVLVEQTFTNAQHWLGNLGLSAEVPGDPKSADTTGWEAWCPEMNGDLDRTRIATSLLMGGADKSDWALWPERDAILIGTQDMLLSRALNRGYAARRPRWPIEFGLLHSDCLWVTDEVQLMGSGLTTTAQLDAFARKLWKPAKTSHFLWMSATIEKSFLRTRDRCDWDLTDGTASTLSQIELGETAIQKRLHAPKALCIIKDRPNAAKILDAHLYGRISLLILNTVPAAKTAYEDIRQEVAKPAAKNKPARPKPTICLLHGRFRPMDREQQMRYLLEFLKKIDASGSVPNSDGLIVVSTQVVEAGFDLSSGRLWSEVAPWPSVIQRLGRLNRDGLQPEASATFWMPKADEINKADTSPNARRIGPYKKMDLDAAKKLLEAVIKEQGQGIAYRNALDGVLATDESHATLCNEPETIIRPNDFFELFSTEPDLAGGFTNVSQFVRDQDRNVDVHVFWRDFNPAKITRPDESAPVQEELCPVPFFEFRQFLTKSRMAWEWNFEVGRWESRRAADVQPGMTLLLPKSAGGYKSDTGWTGDGKNHNFDVLLGSGDEDSLDADFLSGAEEWVSLANHLADVIAELHEILHSIELEGAPFSKALMTAAHWHDWGKSIAKWQDAVKSHIAASWAKLDKVGQAVTIQGFDGVVSDWKNLLLSKDGIAELWGKFPDIRAAPWDLRLELATPDRVSLSRDLRVSFRPALRHEAASALGAFQAWLSKTDDLTALSVYLIACHHGKVRTVLRSRRGDRGVFGLTDGMTLQPVPGFFPNPMALRTDSKYVGACGEWNETGTSFTLTSPSWLQMVAELLGSEDEGKPVTAEVIPDSEPRELGPLVLAYLESLLRAADVRASRKPGKGGKS